MKFYQRPRHCIAVVVVGVVTVTVLVDRLCLCIKI